MTASPQEAQPRFVFHVSESAEIAQFDPRPVREDHLFGIMEPSVWAIGPRLLPNYLLPRECPRVSYYAGPGTTAADIQHFFGDKSPHHVVAVEIVWIPAIHNTMLVVYALPAMHFWLIVEEADYWVSHKTVWPLWTEFIENPAVALIRRGVELLMLPNLWALHEAVTESTLQFSSIRMRNAAPR